MTQASRCRWTIRDRLREENAIDTHAVPARREEKSASALLPPVNEPVPGPERIRRRRRRKGSRVRRAMFVTGIVLLVVGALVLGWVGWQFWGTNWVSERRQDNVASSLEKAWDKGTPRADTKWGTASAIVHVPRFGDDFAVPVLEGTSDEELAAGIGHVLDTAAAGDPGNYVLAAHRVTHGEPFAGLPDLQVGDKVLVETVDATYTYVLDTGGDDLVVPFTDEWVLARFPHNPDAAGPAPPRGVGHHLITLLTCSEIFHTDNRNVVFGHLVKRIAKNS